MRADSMRFLAVAIILPVWACGCRHVLVHTPAFSEDSGIRRIDPNHALFTITKSPRDSNAVGIAAARNLTWKPVRIATNPNDGRPFRIETNGVRSRLTGNVHIRVTMPGGRKYWAVVDTGFASYVYVNDVVIRECGLAVHPLGKNPVTGCPVGFCEIPSMQLGRARVENPPCLYEQGHWQLRVLGVPVRNRPTMLLGLRLMQAHAYVLFDNPACTITFSPREAFEPGDTPAWVRLPFVIEEIDRNRRMLVDLPFGGRTVRVLFDTGGAKPGLRLGETAWEEARHQLNARGGRSAQRKNVQFGRYSCQRYVLPTLSIGKIDVKNVQVDVVPEGSPIVQGYDGILSLNYFRKTAVVLDFRKSLIWIRTF